MKAARPQFRGMLQENLRIMRKQPVQQPSLKRPTTGRVVCAGMVLFVAELWARSEAREIYSGTPPPDGFIESVWNPILTAAMEGRRDLVASIRHYESARDDLTAGPSSQGSGKVTDAVRLKHFKHSLRLLGTYVSGESMQVFNSLAEIAKFLHRPDLVRKVFKSYGKPLYERNRYHKVIATFKTPEEFLRFKHDFHDKYRPRPRQLDPLRAPRPSFVVTIAEQQAIRRLMSRWATALVARDYKTTFACYSDPEKSRKFFEQHDTYDELPHYEALDLKAAQFLFHRHQMSGPVYIAFYAPVTVRRKGRPVQASINIFATIVFKSGQPYIHDSSGSSQDSDLRRLQGNTLHSTKPVQGGK